MPDMKRSDLHAILKALVDTVGIPEVLIVLGAISHEKSQAVSPMRSAFFRGATLQGLDWECWQDLCVTLDDMGEGILAYLEDPYDWAHAEMEEALNNREHGVKEQLHA